MKYAKLVLFLLACLGLTVAGCSPVTRPLWWKFRTNVDNRASMQVDGAQGKLAPLSIPLSLLACPVLWSDQQHKSWFDSRIVVGDVGSLHEFAPANGTEIDNFPTLGTIESCPSAQPDTNVIYATDATLYMLFALNPYNLSKPLWSAPLPHGRGCTVLTRPEICGLGLPTPPVPYGDLVIVGFDTQLVAIKQGTIAWRYDIGPDQFVSTYSGPALSQEVDSAVVIAGRNGKVAKVLADEKLGINQQREVWTYTVGNNITVTETVALGLDLAVFVPGNDGVMYALEPDSDADLAKKGKPRLRWAFDTHTNAPLTAPAVAFIDHPSNEVVYFADNTNRLYALSAKNGWPMWSPVTLPSAATTAPVVTQNNMVYIGVGRGSAASVIAIDRNQKIIWKVAVPGIVRNLAVAENGSIWALAGTNLIRID